MSDLLARPPYSQRDDVRLLAELNRLTAHHRAGCAAYARISAGTPEAAETIEQVPFVHAGVFKHVELRTTAAGIEHQRVLMSSATTGGSSSRIALDANSSQLQSRSSQAILEAWLGADLRPLLVLDAASSLLRRGGLSARVAAAMSLRPLSSEIAFLLRDAEDPTSVDWDEVARLASGHPRLLVYGFTWLLWRSFADGAMPEHARRALEHTQVSFVHSGGWKKLEAMAVPRSSFDHQLLATVAQGSHVLDYYGLVEQVGVIYPLCAEGYRHVPIWADVKVRDPYSLEALPTEAGQLQLLNALAWGAPYHSVLTEDVGRSVPGPCSCGRTGTRFELLGRVPKAELRGCANV